MAKRTKPKHNLLETKDPRETAGLIKCVPKIHLGEVLTARGIAQADFERAMGVGRKSTSHWVNGGRRMSDAAVVRASWLLGVHPLYLLDMTDDPQIYDGSESPYTYTTVARARRSMAEAMAMLRDPIRLMQLIPDLSGTRNCLFVCHATTFGQVDKIVETGNYVHDDKELQGDGSMPSAEEERKAETEVLATLDKDAWIGKLISNLIAMPGDYRDPVALAHAMLGYASAEARDDALDRVFNALARVCIGHGTGSNTDKYDGAANSALKRPSDGRSGLTDTAKDMLGTRARFMAAVDQSTTTKHRRTSSKR